MDDSTDFFLTFNQPAMSDTSSFPYHESVSAWYETFLKVAVRFIASPLSPGQDWQKKQFGDGVQTV